MKEYNGEKAIISLTSWKARINSVSKTIFSILKYCPGFHVVLVLSEDEFPNKKLPADLDLLAKNTIEIIWVKRNYYSFKKVFFTMEKYPDVPIISADDGCIYTRNYAQELYDVWVNNKEKIISEVGFYYKNDYIFGGGVGVLYPPNCFGNYWKKYINNENILKTKHDDGFIYLLIKRLQLPYKIIHSNWRNVKNFTNIITDEVNGINYNTRLRGGINKYISYIEELMI